MTSLIPDDLESEAGFKGSAESCCYVFSAISSFKHCLLLSSLMSFCLVSVGLIQRSMVVEHCSSMMILWCRSRLVGCKTLTIVMLVAPDVTVIGSCSIGGRSAVGSRSDMM